MIVDPDFLTHWRTKMVMDALDDDEKVPLYIIRIWAHCQSRRATRFESMPCAGLKALCQFKGDAAQLEAALIDAGFIVRDGAAINVPKWAEHNAKLIANWKNGATGGRPKQTEEEPNDNPNETQDKPTGTQAKPIGGEERREETTSNPNGLDVAGDTGNQPAKPEKQDCPHQEIIALYHEVLPMCPRIRDWTSARAVQLRARWNEDPKRQNLWYWQKFFKYVSQCDFLVGKSHAKDKRPFFADLEWIVKSANFTKIREGKYAND